MLTLNCCAEERAHRRNSSGAGGGGPLNGHGYDGKRANSGAAANSAAGARARPGGDFVGDCELLKNVEDYKNEDELDHSFDQPPTDFTFVLAGKRRLTAAVPFDLTHV
jgi:hypothetical protein